MEKQHKITTIDGKVIGVHDFVGSDSNPHRFAASYDNGFSLYEKSDKGYRLIKIV